jgi:hypothetical protein
MRKLLPVAAMAMALFTFAASPAAAIQVTGDFDVSYNDVGGDDGLDLIINPDSGSFDFALDTVGATKTFTLFRISTPEGSVNADDLNDSPIAVTFGFDSPFGASGDPITGGTSGESNWFWIFNFQNGLLTWDGPQSFSFGNGGLFTVSLNGAEFNDGFYGLGEDGAKVKATFTLDSLSSAVPEPATWAMMITGFGLAGTAIRRRRSTFAVA